MHGKIMYKYSKTVSRTIFTFHSHRILNVAQRAVALFLGKSIWPVRKCLLTVLTIILHELIFRKNVYITQYFVRQIQTDGKGLFNRLSNLYYLSIFLKIPHDIVLTQDFYF